MKVSFTLFSPPSDRVNRMEFRPHLWLLVGLFLLLAGLPVTLYSQAPIPPKSSQRQVPFAIRFDAGKRTSAANAQQVFKQQLKLGKNDQLMKIKTERDPKGFTHEKFEQRYKGVRVEYGEMKTHSRRGAIESITGKQYNIPEIAVQVQLSESAALQKAMTFVGAKTYRWQNAAEETWLKKELNNPKASHFPKGELVICQDFLNSPGKEKMVLAYKFDIYALEPLSRDYVYVDANTGKVIHRNAIIKHADGTAETRYSGTRTIQTEQFGSIYALHDDSRGQGVETYSLQNLFNYSAITNFIDNDNNWTAQEYNNANKDNVALDAHWGAQKVYDYWKNVHGRRSYDGQDSKIINYVHYGINYENAFWNGEALVFGDGGNRVNPMTSLDLVAHEFGHGVMKHTADLIYRDESGALNEGFSDIWGAVIEHYAAPEKQTWLIGEEFAKQSIALRSMSNPNELGDADTYLGTYWRVGTQNFGGVHHNSGVLNHWFYILSEGKTGTNDNGTPYAVTGIGIDKAAQIAYRTQSVYLIPTSNFQDTRVASILAAIDLFGENSNEVAQTEKAWDAVGVGSPFTLTLTVISNAEIDLAWQVQHASIVRFDVERSSSPESGFASIASLGTTINSYNNTGLTVGNTYYYRIKATLANGFAHYSPVRGVVLGAPEPPTLLSANGIGNTVQLSWQDNSSNETSFQLERSLSPTSGFTPLATLDPNTTTYQDSPPSNVYFYRVRSQRLGSSSLYSNVARGIVGNITVMSNAPVTTCDQLFLDPGGNGDYLNYEDLVQTFTPESPDVEIKVVFNAFQLEDDNYNDVLYIYDGPSTSSPLIGAYTGTRSPGTITATNPTGQLTFRFYTNTSVVSSGWSATVSCHVKLTAAASSPIQVTLNWTDQPDETNYLIERSLSPTTGFTQIVDLPANTTTYLDNVATNNIYYYRYRTFRSDISSYSDYSNVARGVVGNITLMSNDAVTTCDQLFLDPGANENYSINRNFIQTFTPATENTALKVVFNSFDLETGYDFLYIYDGANTTAPLIGKYTGTTSPGTITAHNPTGQLTFLFISDISEVRPGWSANISCIPVPLAPDQQLSGNEDSPLAVTLAASGTSALTYNLLTSPKHGTLSGTAPDLTYTPAANYFGADSLTYFVTGDGFTSRTATVSLTVNSVNDAPSFVKGANQTVPGNPGLQTSPAWATSLSAGPANEAGQSLSFTVVADQPGWFSVQPAIASNGTLTYTPASNASGTTTLSVTLTDNGGTDNGGVNSSTQFFTITIQPRPILTVKAINQSKTYGQANPTLTFSYRGFVDGEDEADLDTPPTSATSATSASDAGNYPITVNGAVDTKYIFVYENATLTVNKAGLTATSDNQNKTYGAANPMLTFAYTGFVNGDNAADLDTQPSISTTATTASHGGNYPISLSGGEDNNYTFSLVNGILTVEKATIRATADNQSRAYGVANPPLTISYSGFVNGEDAKDLDTPPTASTNAVLNSPSGDYPITLSGGVDTDYLFSLVNGTLSVGKTQLTVTAINQSKTYGQANPTLTFSYSGFAGGDDADDLDTAPTLNTNATTSSDAGSYLITVSGGVDGKYSFAYVNATLVVSKKTLAAKADNKSRNVGLANPALTVTYSGFVNGDDAADLDTPPAPACLATVASPAGLYAITLSGGLDNNYSFALESGVLTVVPVVPNTCSATGVIIRETWVKVKGYDVRTIPVNTPPTATRQLTQFEGPSNVTNEYGDRIRGYICPPTSGNYTFWIASDDNSVLYLSSDDQPNKKQRIAWLNGATAPREWTKYASQQSVPIYLQAGKKYYIESLHKEVSGNDHVAVGWQLPSGALERPIPGKRLSPFVVSATTRLVEMEEELATVASLSAAPNPFSDETILLFKAAVAGQASVAIYDLNGNLVQTLFEGKLEAGESKELTLEATPLPSGVYLVKATSLAGVSHLKLVLAK